MRFRLDVNSLKNAVGTVFLLAAAFFVCSTFVSMRSVFADPIVQTNNIVQKSGRASPRFNTTTRANVSRSTVSRAKSAVAQPGSRTAVSRGTGTRNVSSRSITPTRSSSVSTRNVKSRNNTQNKSASNRSVRARSGATQSRVSATGSVMAGARASTSNTYSYLSSKLYTGSYSNIIDSSTGLISADAYSNCLESYYACMDEICTARSDTKGRCSCAGRVNNFLEAETQLEAANEELIKLSGQLSLLIATKGKGRDLSAAFSLTDAEKVMNCVSYKEAEDKDKWCEEHPTFTDTGAEATCAMPSYCSSSNNSFGFDIKNIDGSSSDILSQLKAWADAKDLAKEYSEDNVGVLSTKTNYLKNIVNNMNASDQEEEVSLDSLANKWGYKLFEYAHNNVCGRVLDSCFNGIYEACGTPPAVKDSEGNTHKKCANGATSSCPYNYNSYISVVTDATSSSSSKNGDVVLNERGNASEASSASCFGYTTQTTTVASRTATTISSDPYATLRGPVADARRSIMQKYLLDANAACDVYGAALKQTAQNINYQKIAAEQALQQKRLEFKQEADSKAVSEATAAIDNFNECISEIWDCYENYEDEDSRWTTARIKAYCSQVSQVPHCYETMICSPLQTQLTAVIDLPDAQTCVNSDDYTENTCRNVVTINEILYGTGSALGSAALRDACLDKSLNCGTGADATEGACLRNWKKGSTSSASSIETTATESNVSQYNILYFARYGEESLVRLNNITPNTYTASKLGQQIEPVAPSKTGYVFSGWCFSDDLSSCGTRLVIPANKVGDISVIGYYEEVAQ
jgi:hypothetical protein